MHCLCELCGDWNTFEEQLFETVNQFEYLETRRYQNNIFEKSGTKFFLPDAMDQIFEPSHSRRALS
jgi:hypothetical protein